MRRRRARSGEARRRPWPPHSNSWRPPATRLARVSKAWVLTGSLDNFRATREHGFRVIGAKEGRRGMAEQIEPGDGIVFYVTGLQGFGGIVRGTGELYE